MHNSSRKKNTNRRAANLFIGGTILLSICIGCGAPSPAGFPRGTLCVAFYNVENLFDLNRDGSEYELYTPSPTGWNQIAYSKKLANSASALKALNADILGLCEIENRRAMEELQAALSRRGNPYRYAAIAESENTSSTCPVLLSRVPIIEKTSIPVSLPNKEFSRPILSVLLLAGQDTLRILVNHWPSKYWPASFRKAGAEALTRYLATLPKGRDYLILGDFNSNFDEWESITGTSHNDCGDSTSVNHFLGTIRRVSVDSVCYTSRVSAQSQGHVDLWTDINPRYRCSYVYRGQPQTPDHIIVAPSLFDSRGFSYVPGSFDVFTWSGRLLWNGRPFRWEVMHRDGSRRHTGRGFSDHLPIKAYIRRASLTGDSKPQTASWPNCRSEFHCGFETGFEGWTPVSGKVRWLLDTINPFGGGFHLHLLGKLTGPSAVAQRRWRVKPGTRDFRLTLSARGTARIAVRYRWDSATWHYAQIDRLPQSGRSRYVPFRADTWQTLSARCGSPPADSSVLEIEIRSHKGVIDLCLDEVAITHK